MNPVSADAPMLRALHKVTGYSSFRPTQQEAIEAVCEGRDVLLVLATGGGKSACFQVPGLLKSQAVLVISPTISLMKDQVSSLLQRGLAACLLGSASSQHERRGAYAGQFQFVYVTPEYLATRSMDELGELHRNCKFCCLAVDEAHCISQWGKGYRDSFLALSRVRGPNSPLREVPWIAVTATASRAVQMEIAATLVLRSPLVICGSVERPNLHISVTRKPSEDTGMAASMLMELILGKPCRLLPHPQPFESSCYSSSGCIRPTIVYCVSRSEVDQFCSLMNASEQFQGRVAGYSAALSQEARARAAQQFAEGTVSVILATTAFGLGVNKKDVRLVINWGPPGSLSMYMQMVGRAGRDLCPARCMLFWSPTGINTRKFVMRQNLSSGQGNNAAEQREFEDMLKYMKKPTGCRHAFLTQNFGNAENAPGIHTLCHGGCDVCDLCVAAVRDLSCRFCRIILLLCRGKGLVEPELLKRCIATPRNQVGADGACGQASTAVWMEIAHEMINMGLLMYVPHATGGAETEATARHLCVTQAGEEELQCIQRAMQQKIQQSAAATGARAAPETPLTGRMRTRRLATQALTLCSVAVSHQVAEQVEKGRKNLEELCADIDCSAQLSEAFRTVLPCVAWEASICDIAPEALREHSVDIVLWTCMKQCIIALARGASDLSYYDMKHSADFVRSKREWCRRAEKTSAAQRMQSALAEGQVQAFAVQKQQSKAKVSLALKKLGRKLEALKRTQQNSGSATVLTQPHCDKLAVALPTSIEELAACGLPDEVVNSYGQQILDAIKGAPKSSSQVNQISTQRCSGQENRGSAPAQTPGGTCTDLADGCIKRAEPGNNNAPAPISIAARFASKKRCK